MKTEKAISLKITLLATSLVLATLTLAPLAGATPVRIRFNGAAGGGSANLTLTADPNSSSAYQPTYSASDAANGSTPLSAYDPAGAQRVTGAAGNIDIAYRDPTDAAKDFSLDASIDGLAALDSGTPPPGEILPASFSWLGGNSYDNLFYAGGSPLVCPPTSAGGPVGYPFSGGFLDIYGVMFALDNGDYMDLWSAGAMPGLGLNYGYKVLDPSGAILYAQANGVVASVPAPRFVWLFGAALLGLFGWRRAVERHRVEPV